MRRKAGTLLPIERSILAAVLELRLDGTTEAHGYLVASVIRDREEARALVSHGTLYKALDRLRRWGMLDDRWEDPVEAAEAGRPRRRLYTITALGERAFIEAAEADQAPSRSPRAGWQPT